MIRFLSKKPVHKRDAAEAAVPERDALKALQLLLLGVAGVVAAVAAILSLEGGAGKPVYDPIAWLDLAEEEPAPIDAVRPLAFPADHGAHPAARAEMWRFAGMLADRANRRHGFQLSFSRLHLDSRAPPRDSAWAANEVYHAHFALARQNPQKFLSFERFGRAALDLAGHREDPPKLWLEEWSMAVSEAAGGGYTIKLHAAGKEAALDLTLTPVKAAVSPVSSARLRLYLFSRLRAEGFLALEGMRTEVSGEVFFDHGFGNLPLSGGQLAWNLFALQLDDGRELVITQSRRRDGSGTPVESGFLIDRDGSSLGVEREDLKLSASGYWKSPATGIRYPIEWHARLPQQGLDLFWKPLIEGQEADHALRFWGGAVTVSGGWEGRPVSGFGYMQLSGYEAGKR